MSKPQHLFEISIRATPEKVWERITRPESARRYLHETDAESDWRPKLTLLHDGFETETRTFREAGSGWSPILSSLKTLLETGEPLPLAS